MSSPIVIKGWYTQGKILSVNKKKYDEALMCYEKSFRILSSWTIGHYIVKG